jgi:hypothetical protein
MRNRGWYLSSDLCGWGSGLSVFCGRLCRWLPVFCGMSTVLRSGGCPDSPSPVYLLVGEFAPVTRCAASLVEEEVAGRESRGASAAVSGLVVTAPVLAIIC